MPRRLLLTAAILSAVLWARRRMNARPSGDTLDFILKFIQDAPEKQIRDMNDLDGKVIQVFSAASIVIGLAGVSSLQSTNKPVVIGLLADAVFSYAVVAGLAVWHLFAKRVRVARYGDRLWSNYWNESVATIEHALVADIERAYRHNKRVLRDKATTTKLALVTTGLEVGFVALALVAARLP